MMIELADEILKKAMIYADDAEVFLEKGKSQEIQIRDNKIDLSWEGSSFGIGLRIIKNNKLGFSYTSDIKKIDKMIENCVKNANSNVKDKNFNFAKPSKYKKPENIYDPKFFEDEIKYEFVKEMIEICKEKNCNLVTGGFSASLNEVTIVNSNDVECYEKSTTFSAYLSVNTGNENKSSAHESDSSRMMDLDPKIAERACNIAIESLKPKSFETCNIDVVFDYHAASSLLDPLVNALNSDNVQRGRSIFANKINQKVTTSNLTVYDNGIVDKGINSSSFDDEGVPSQNTTLIKKGILKGFMYDLYTAKKENKKSTGNGLRSSFSETPKVSPTNLIFDFEEKIKMSEIKRAILVYDVLGAHTANPISGDFSVKANNAFLIENGEIKYPIKDIMIFGNVFSMLKKLNAIKSKIRQIGPFIIPKFYVKDIHITA